MTRFHLAASRVSCLIVILALATVCSAQLITSERVEVTLSNRDVRALLAPPHTASSFIDLTLDPSAAGGDVVTVVSDPPGAIISLVLPNGVEVNASNFESHGFGHLLIPATEARNSPVPTIFSLLGTHTLFVLPAGAAHGVYRVKADTSQVPQQSLITATYLSSSPIRVGVDSDSLYRVGDSVFLAGLVFDESTPFSGANVKAVIEEVGRADTPPVELALLDSGPADEAAGDGIYSGAFLAERAGNFSVSVRVTGVSASGVPFSRGASKTFQVIDPPAGFVSFEDAGTDDDADGRPERVVVKANVEVRTAGNYQFSVTLVEGNGKELNASGFAELAVGSGQIGVGFASGALYTMLGADGPYRMKKATLILQSPAADILADYREDAGATAPYTVSTLGPRIAFPGPNSAEGVDANGNGKFDILRVKSQVVVANAGDYIWSAILMGPDGYEIAFDSGAGSLAVGANEITLDFSGYKIGARGLDGPYSVESVLIAGAGASAVVNKLLTTESLDTDQFEGGIALNCGTGVDLLDVDQNGKFDLLGFNVGMQIPADGYYQIEGTLIAPNGTPIKTLDVSRYLVAGANTVSFLFDGRLILQNGSDGTYTLGNVRLSSDDEANGSSAFSASLCQTPPLVASQFEGGVRLTCAGGAESFDRDGSGKFDVLHFDVGMYAPNYGSYRAVGVLTDPTGAEVATEENYYYLNQGANSVQFEFDGKLIGDNAVDGPYTLSVTAVLDFGSELPTAAPGLCVSPPLVTAQFDRSPVQLTLGAVDVAEVGGDSDGVIEPGEGGSLKILVFDASHEGRAYDVSATLTTSTPGVTITTADSGYPTIEARSGSVNAVPFAFSVAADAPPASVVEFTLTIRSRSHGPFVFNFPVRTGPQPKLAFTTVRDGNFEIYSMNSDGTNQTNLTKTPAGDYSPAWSPDGLKLAFFSDRDEMYQLYVMDADGTNQRRVPTPDVWVFSKPVWSPDGGRLVFRGYTAEGTYDLFVVKVADASFVRLTNDGLLEDNIHWSPNSERIAFTRQSETDYGVNDLFTVNADGSGELQVTTGLTVGGLDWSPDGLKFIFVNIGAYDFDTGQYEANIHVMNADGSGRTRLTENLIASTPVWSPAGDKIAFSHDQRIYSMKADGSDLRNLTDIPFFNSFEHFTGYREPVWSPDGGRIAFAAEDYNTGDTDIYTLNADGSGPTRLTHAFEMDAEQVWRPSGSTPPPPADQTPPVTTASVVQSGGQPGAGFYNGPVEVTLSAADDLSGVDRTFYAIDGGAEQLYAAPFAVNGEQAHSITFHSVDKAHNVEAARTQSIVIDSTAPVTEATTAPAPNPSGWNNAAVDVSLSATDNLSGVDTTRYTLDGGPLQTYSAAFNVAGDGVHAVSFHSVDAAGNAEASKSLTVRIDAAAPTIAPVGDISLEADGPEGSAATYFASAADLLDPDVTLGYSHASGSTFALGSTTVTVTAVDNAGNTATSTFTVTVRDTGAPTVACPADIIIVAAPGASSAAVNFTITGGDSVSGVTLTSSVPSGSPFPLGDTTVTATATDAAGNASQPCAFKVTVKSPTATTVQPVAAQYSDAVVLHAAVGAAAVSGQALTGGVEFFVNGSPVGTAQLVNGAAALSLNVNSAAGLYNVTAQFTGTNPYYVGSAGGPATLTVTKENATTAYTGDAEIMTAGPTVNTANARLGAHLTPEADGNPGDITKATVAFELFGSTNMSGTPDRIISNVVVDSNGDATATVDNLTADTYFVNVKVDGANPYWTAQPVGTGVLSITVPTTDKRSTGGGWVADPASKDGKAIFGFAVKLDKSDGRVKGHSAFIFRGTDGYIYAVWGIDWQGGYLKFSNEPGVTPAVATRSNFKGRCFVLKLNPESGRIVSLLTNYSFEVFTKDGNLLNPRQADAYAITVRDGNGQIWHQVGSSTSPVALGGGNITNKSK